MCCHTETEVEDQTRYLTQSQHTDTRSTSPSADPISPGAWQDSHWSTNLKVTGMTPPSKQSTAKAGIELRSAVLEADTFIPRPMRRTLLLTAAVLLLSLQSEYLSTGELSPLEGTDRFWVVVGAWCSTGYYPNRNTVSLEELKSVKTSTISSKQNFINLMLRY